MLEVDEFSDLEGVRDVTAPLRGPEHVRWRGLAGRADMRFVAVTLPRLLARHPVGGRSQPRRRFPLSRICAHRRDTACG